MAQLTSDGTAAGTARPLYEPQLQAMTPEARRALQDEGLAEVSRAAFKIPIPFLQRRLERAGLGPGDLCLDTLSRVAPVTKDALRASEREHPPFGDYRGAPPSACVRVAQTSGTTGQPTVVFWTARDLAVEHAAYARNQWRQGYRPGQTILVTAHPGYLNGGEPLVRSAAEACGFLCVSLGPPTDEAALDAALLLLQRLRPNRYVLLPPTHLRLWEAARARGLDPEADLGLEAPVDHVTFQWRQVSAGLDAFAYLGTECAERDGAHVNEDFAVIEVLGPDGRPAAPGTRGHLVITTIGRDNVVLRYDTEDLVRAESDPCPCGETTLRLFWDGRSADVVDVAGTGVLPVDVALELTAVPELCLPAPIFQLVRHRPTQDRLKVRAEGTGGDDAMARLAARLGVPVEVTMVAPGSLPRSAYKPVQVIDE